MRLGETKIIQTDDLTGDTVINLMIIARSQAVDPAVRRTVQNIVAGTPEKQWTAEIQKIFGWVKNHVRYLRDPEGTEYVQTPTRHIANIERDGVSFGDCDDMSLLLATLLRSAGYKTKFVIISSPGNNRGTFNHIFTEVSDPSIQTWIALDATMKDKPYGWRPEFNKRKEFSI